jgi:uncharacterized protein with HEPN domain
MPKDFRVFVDDILECIRRINFYIEGMSYDSFLDDIKTIDAVLRNLEIIGEAAKSIPDNIRQNIPNIEWQKVIGLRNILIHRYSGIDLEIIWDIIGQKLPLLEQRMKQILETK